MSIHPKPPQQVSRAILPIAVLSLALIIPQVEAGKVIIGAADNTAGGPRSVVAGGKNNTSSAGFAFIGAGRGNKVEATDASVLGGNQNTAAGAKSSVLTGYLNNSAGLESAIVSGIRNITSAGAIRSAVLSGTDNVIEETAWSSSIGAGYRNSNGGDRSAILMGTDNVIGANALNTMVAGIKASSNHKNSFVFNSSLANPLATTKNGQFLVNATGGAIINGGTTIQGPLTVSGGLSYEGGDGSIIALVGPAGQDGVDGADGEQGPAGTNGSDGVGVSQTTIDADGNLIVTLTNGTEINAGQIGNSNSTLKLSKNSVVFDYTGGTGSVGIQSDSYWIGKNIVNNGSEWLTYDNSREGPDGTFPGNGNQTFTFEAAELNGDVPRETVFRFQSASGPISGWDFVIRQEPKPAGDFSWQQLGTDIDGEAVEDYSGFSVSLSADGNTVAIGAPYNESYSGHVRIYHYINSSWQQLGTDIDGEVQADESGCSVSLSADGSTVAIGAFYNGGNGSSSGHVRVYQYINSSWVQLGADIDGEAAFENSGWSVSLSADGSTVAIGAPFNDGNGDFSGHVRIYQYIDSTWQQLGADIDGEATGDSSGWSVSLSADGSTVAIGAIGNDGNGDRSGHVRVYQYINSSWQQLGADIDGEVEGDFSGYSVSLSADGSTVAIGATGNGGNGIRSGHVRVYQYINSSWQQLGADIDGEAAGDESGDSVSLSADGGTVAIGATQNDGNGKLSGHVRIYHYINSSWQQLGTDIDGEAEYDQSGYSVSLSSDGSTVAIGAPQNDGNGVRSGHVRVYELTQEP